MKAKPQKVVNTGKVGQIAGKRGKQTPDGGAKMVRLDKQTVGSALGLLGKHFK